jgi:hypothetical protein
MLCRQQFLIEAKLGHYRRTLIASLDDGVRDAWIVSQKVEPSLRVRDRRHGMRK